MTETMKHLLFIFILLFMISCSNSKEKKFNNIQQDTISNIVQSAEKQTVTFGTFSTFPPEIDGCSCCFSNNATEFKKGEYIYMNDFAQISFMKINGVLTKFTLTDFQNIDSLNIKAKYKSDNYELIIETKDENQKDSETTIKTGTIKLTNKKGAIVSRRLYGECGC